MRGPAALFLLAGLVLGLGAAGRPATPDPVLGRRVYEVNCAVCHGERGDGRGHAAHHFATPPRDFTTGRYKLRSTPSGQLPTDVDLRRSIVQGLPGTGMVPHDHLGEPELAAVIEHIKAFSPRFTQLRPAAPLAIPPAPPRTPEAVARGRRVYEKAECEECHGRDARGDGPSAKDLKVKPTDLTRRPFKSGPSPTDIVRTLLTGLDGTPMPSYHLIVDDDELWELAYYVDALATPPVLTEDERWGWHVVQRHQGRSAPPRVAPR